MRGLPPEVAALCSRQHHAVSRHQLIELGCAKTTIDRWVAEGLLCTVHHGVYGLVGAAPSYDQRLVAAVLRAGPEARVGGPSACWLHGIEGFGTDWPPWVLIPRERRVAGVPFMVVRAGWEDRDERTVRGIPTVSAALGLIDAAAAVSEKRLRVGVDSGRRLGLIRLDRLVERAVELGNRRGAAVVRRVYEAGRFAQESEGERAMAKLFRPGDPQPDWGVWVYPDLRVDAIFLAARLVLEYDGRDYHTIDTDRDHDSRRELRLKNDQIEVIRITWSMVRDTPAETRARVLSIYRQRIALRLPPVSCGNLAPPGGVKFPQLTSRGRRGAPPVGGR